MWCANMAPQPGAFAEYLLRMEIVFGASVLKLTVKTRPKNGPAKALSFFERSEAMVVSSVDCMMQGAALAMFLIQEWPSSFSPCQVVPIIRALPKSGISRRKGCSWRWTGSWFVARRPS